MNQANPVDVKVGEENVVAYIPPTPMTKVKVTPGTYLYKEVTHAGVPRIRNLYVLKDHFTGDIPEDVTIEVIIRRRPSDPADPADPAEE